ncbi:unnamed protein product [Toxocara canis]|uniref:Transmembrane protein n=1 Tax=Toxocara canis TaxID=6265 RepID=A0A183TZT8_TOXCA|nr:unnamed protein product [Toxocara canis]
MASLFALFAVMILIILSLQFVHSTNEDDDKHMVSLRTDCPYCILDGSSCVSEVQLAQMVHDRLFSNVTTDACQKALMNVDDAICWCKKPGFGMSWWTTLCKRADPSSPSRRRANRMKLPLIVAVLIVYVLLGSAAFLFFEHAYHEQQVRKWYLHHAINRFVAKLYA